MGAASPGSDPREIRELLAAAEGYAVLDQEGRRVGEFIEFAGPGADQIAIRDDGVLLWRRRLLPITSVASVLPEQRAILLDVDRRTLSGTEAAADTPAQTAPSTDEGAEVAGEWQERVARYASANENDADRHITARHLLFVSTTHGYALVEQEGPPPPLGRRIEVPAQANSFRVAKLGPSPLPNDPRICAYLEQTEEP
jgi:hypothetical protein